MAASASTRASGTLMTPRLRPGPALAAWRPVSALKTVVLPAPGKPVSPTFMRPRGRPRPGGPAGHAQRAPAGAMAFVANDHGGAAVVGRDHGRRARVVHQLQVDRRTVRERDPLDAQVDDPPLVDLLPHPSRIPAGGREKKRRPGMPAAASGARNACGATARSTRTP